MIKNLWELLDTYLEVEALQAPEAPVTEIMKRIKRAEAARSQRTLVEARSPNQSRQKRRGFVLPPIFPRLLKRKPLNPMPYQVRPLDASFSFSESIRALGSSPLIWKTVGIIVVVMGLILPAPRSERLSILEKRSEEVSEITKQPLEKTSVETASVKSVEISPVAEHLKVVAEEGIAKETEAVVTDTVEPKRYRLSRASDLPLSTPKPEQQPLVGKEPEEMPESIEAPLKEPFVETTPVESFETAPVAEALKVVREEGIAKETGGVLTLTDYEQQTRTRHSPSLIEVAIGPSASPVELELFPLPAKSHLIEYRALDKKLELEHTEEVVVIIVVKFSNTMDIPVETTLGDIVSLTGRKRPFFVAYILMENSQEGMPTYLLPNWQTVLRIDAKQAVTLRMAFILKKGEHAVFEKTVKIYACFSHAVWQGVYHSVSISQRKAPEESRGEAEVQTKVDDYGVEQIIPPATFQISDELNAISVRQIRPPTVAMSRGGQSVFLSSLLGDLGKDDQLPYWIGVAQAIEEGAFDYRTAMQFLDAVADYRERFPEKLARTTIWLKSEGILFVPTEHHVYIATSGRGVIKVPHEVAEALLYVASEAILIGIAPSDVVPIPGSYTPLTSANPGEAPGFQIDCVGILIQASRVGNSYQVKVTPKDGGSQSLTKILEYHRKV